MKGYLLFKKMFVKVLCSLNSKGRCCCKFTSNLVIFFISCISRSFQRIKPNLVGRSFITSKYVGYIGVHIDQQRTLLYYYAFSSDIIQAFMPIVLFNRIELNLVGKTLIITKTFIKFWSTSVIRWSYQAPHIFLGFHDIFYLSQKTLISLFLLHRI